MSAVFITYAPDGEELARTLARGLEIHGYHTWYRGRDGCLGPSLVGQNEARLGECAAVLAIITPGTSPTRIVPWFEGDLRQGRKLGKPLVPVLHQVKPDQLQRRLGELAQVLEGAIPIVLPPGDPWEAIPQIAGRLAEFGVPRTRRTHWPPPIAALVRQHRLPAVDLREANAADPSCACHLDRESAETYTAIPIECTGAVIVALGDPAQAPEVAAAGNFGLHGMEPVIADPAAIRELIPWYYGDDVDGWYPGKSDDS
jgi:hypothetical protein